MRLILLLMLAVFPARAGDVRALLTGPTGGGVYEIPAGAHDLSGLYVLRGHLWGSEDRPIVISGAGPETILRCPGVCYFEASQWVTFRDLTIEGAINSRHLRHWRFERVAFRDAGIGWPQKVLLKATGAPYPERKPVDVGAGPIEFEGCTFDPSPDGADTALDFVATQGVKILRSTFERCNRGCLQAKGGSGIREPFEIAHNWIKDGGQRGVFVGGGANPEFFDPPIDEARAEFGAASIHDNTIVGAASGNSACFVAGTVAGPVAFEHNLCIGQRGYVIRLLDENQHPATKEGVRNVTVRRNLFATWEPPQWPNTNVVQTTLANSIRWESIAIDDNIFGFASRSQYWGWPDRNPLPTTGNIDRADVAIEYDDGKPRVANWPEYGPRPDPPTDERAEPLTVCVSLSTHPDQLHCWQP